MHRMEELLGPRIGLGRKERTSLLRHKIAVDEDKTGPEVLEVVEHDDVCTLARRHRAQVSCKPEALGHVDRDHLDGGDGVDPEGDRLPKDPVEMSLRDKRLGMCVIRHEVHEARVNLVVRHGMCKLFEIVPGRAFTQLCILPEAQLCQRIFARDRLMAA